MPKPNRKPYVPPRKIYKIEVEDGAYTGLFARLRSVPTGRFMDLAAMAEGFDLDSLKSAHTNTKNTADALAVFGQMRSLFEAFAKALIEWNVELPEDPDDEDSPLVPVPPTFEGIMSQDMDLVMFLVGEWLSAVGGTSPPLGATPKTADGSNDAASQEMTLADLSQPLSSVPS